MAKDRNHKNGRFRRSETSSYKMTRHDGFDAVSWQAFQEAATEKYDFKSGCPDGFRDKGSQTVAGKRRKVCCSPDGKTCITEDGIPL